MTGPAAIPPFPGGTGISDLAVYDWEAADGLHGGSPHLHTSCTECYVVTAGAGRLQTLTEDGLGEVELRPGDVVWFTPGMIHRAVDEGGLRVVVVMGNSGLPEAGDAVMTLPPEHLATPEAYRAATSLDQDGAGATPAERARARRDLAVAGFTALAEAVAAGDVEPLERFRAAAAALVRPRLADFERQWRAGALAAATATGEQLRALAAGDHGHLRSASVHRLRPPAERTWGMCGRLVAYDGLR